MTSEVKASELRQRRRDRGDEPCKAPMSLSTVVVAD